MSNGTRQYNSFSKRLQPYNIQVITTLEEFTNDPNQRARTITLQCENDHVFTVKSTSLGNTFSKVKRGLLPGFCAECNKPESVEKLKAIERCKELGFEFINFEFRNVTFRCVCGEERNTHIGNLLRESRQAQCQKCQNNKNRHSQDAIQKAFAEKGCELLSEYTSRHTPVDYKCECGTISTVRYSDFIRGKRCQECKKRKYKEYYQKHHGVDNVFQLEETKVKSRKTCKEKYGVEHCMQNPEIFHKARRKCYNNKRKATYKGYTWIIEGYENFCLEDLLQDYHPSDIKTGKDVPSIDYILNGKQRVWHPDFYIPSVNLIIEVKSTYTYDCAIKATTAKIKQCPYNCELRVYSKKGELLDVVYNAAGEIHSAEGLVELGYPINKDLSYLKK